MIVVVLVGSCLMNQYLAPSHPHDNGPFKVTTGMSIVGMGMIGNGCPKVVMPRCGKVACSTDRMSFMPRKYRKAGVKYTTEELQTVNWYWNEHLRPVHVATTAVNFQRGDCKTYSADKRYELIHVYGWPPGSLTLRAVHNTDKHIPVPDEAYYNHQVLVVSVLLDGRPEDLVLDNVRDEIRTLKTAYSDIEPGYEASDLSDAETELDRLLK